MLQLYSKLGKTEQLESLYKQATQEWKITPDAATFMVLIKYFQGKQNKEKVANLIQEMKSWRVIPDLQLKKLISAAK